MTHKNKSNKKQVHWRGGRGRAIKGRTSLHKSINPTNPDWGRQASTKSKSYSHLKGVYPQSNVSLAMIDIDASKGFVDLWVHLFFAIFSIFDLKRELNLLEMACDQVQTCLIFPLRWACFPIEIGRNAQWVHLFSMDFDDFLTIYLIF